MYGIHLTGFRQQLVLLEGSVMIIILKIYVIKYHMKILKIILIRIEQNPSLKSVKTVYVTKLLLSGWTDFNVFLKKYTLEFENGLNP